jgi:hypothetical protein
MPRDTTKKPKKEKKPSKISANFLTTKEQTLAKASPMLSKSLNM